MGAKAVKPEKVHDALTIAFRDGTELIRSMRIIEGKIESLKHHIGANENLLSILECFAFAVNTIYVQPTVGGLEAVAKKMGKDVEKVKLMAKRSWTDSMRCLDEFIRENITSGNVYQADWVEEYPDHLPNRESKFQHADSGINSSHDDVDCEFEPDYDQGRDWDDRTPLVSQIDGRESFVVGGTTLVLYSRDELDRMKEVSVRVISEYFLKNFNPFQENLKEAIANQMTALEQLEKQLKEIKMKVNSNQKKRVNCGTNVYLRHPCPDYISKHFERNSVNKPEKFSPSPVTEDAWKAWQEARSLEHVPSNSHVDDAFPSDIPNHGEQKSSWKRKKHYVIGNVELSEEENEEENRTLFNGVQVPTDGENGESFVGVIESIIHNMRGRKSGIITFPHDLGEDKLERVKKDILRPLGQFFSFEADQNKKFVIHATLSDLPEHE